MNNFNNKILSFTSTCKDGNIAYHVGDDPSNVDMNRSELARKYGYSKLVYMEQVHKDRVVIVDEKTPLHVEQCDALITDLTGTALMVMMADCIGISFYDSVKNVIGVAHAGRNGTFLNISKAVIESMVKNFGSDPKEINVSFSAAIQKCCYEVDESLALIAKKNFGEKIINNNHLNLQLINKNQLLECGILDENICVSPICTKCSHEPYFSYRNDKNCGRFCSVIMIK